jgi:hypothetical protein
VTASVERDLGRLYWMGQISNERSQMAGWLLHRIHAEDAVEAVHRSGTFMAVCSHSVLIVLAQEPGRTNTGIALPSGETVLRRQQKRP